MQARCWRSPSTTRQAEPSTGTPRGQGPPSAWQACLRRSRRPCSSAWPPTLRPSRPLPSARGPIRDRPAWAPVCSRPPWRIPRRLPTSFWSTAILCSSTGALPTAYRTRDLTASCASAARRSGRRRPGRTVRPVRRLNRSRTPRQDSLDSRLPRCLAGRRFRRLQVLLEAEQRRRRSLPSWSCENARHPLPGSRLWGLVPSPSGLSSPASGSPPRRCLKAFCARKGRRTSWSASGWPSWTTKKRACWRAFRPTRPSAGLNPRRRQKRLWSARPSSPIWPRPSRRSLCPKSSPVLKRPRKIARMSQKTSRRTSQRTNRRTNRRKRPGKRRKTSPEKHRRKRPGPGKSSSRS